MEGGKKSGKEIDISCRSQEAPNYYEINDQEGL
jgi:hypothetical protein